MNQEIHDLTENFEGQAGDFADQEERGGKHLEVFDNYGRLYSAANFEGNMYYPRIKEIKKELKKVLW